MSSNVQQALSHALLLVSLRCAERGGGGGGVVGLQSWNVRALPILSVLVCRGLRAAADRPVCARSPRQVWKCKEEAGKRCWSGE